MNADSSETSHRERTPSPERQGRGTSILLAAAVSFVLSVALWFGGHELQGIFVGLWVPSILSLGAVVLRTRSAMSAVGLFAMGVFVTLVVGAALGLLVYGAILDGRYAEEHRGRGGASASPRVVAGHRPAA